MNPNKDQDEPQGDNPCPQPPTQIRRIHSKLCPGWRVLFANAGSLLITAGKGPSASCATRQEGPQSRYLRRQSTLNPAIASKTRMLRFFNSLRAEQKFPTCHECGEPVAWVVGVESDHLFKVDETICEHACGNGPPPE